MVRSLSTKLVWLQRGIAQIPGLDYYEAYSPVSSLTAFRALLAVSVALELQIRHFDIETAFFYGKARKPCS